jgi:hypothetical protein
MGGSDFVHRASQGVVLLALTAGLAVAGPRPSAAASGASQYLYERTLMSVADARCHLFSPDISQALAASRAQARNAALRAGDPPAAVVAVEARAQAKAAGVACGGRDLQVAAARLRAAFADYAKLQVLNFPWTRSAWRAERPYPAYHGPQRWGLVQSAPGQGGWVLFGVSNGVVTVVDARRKVAAAAIARLVVRDPSRLAQPYVDTRRIDPAAQAAPRDVSQVFIARSRGPAPASLLPAGARSGSAYQFSSDALAALARLDPREGGVLELVYPGPGRDRTVAVWIEVGDLAAAEAFLAVGRASIPHG